MKKARKMPELILQLKAVKAERGLSNQDIVDLLRAKGYGTSLSSVKRVFSEGSENMAFSYEDTIMPLVEVLLVEAAPVPVEDLDSLADAQQYIAQIEGLQADALLKDKVIEDLNLTNTSLQTTVDTQTTTIQTQAKTIEDLTKTRKVYRIATAFLVVAFVLLTLMVFAYLIIHDAPNPNYGILPPYFAGETAAYVEQAYNLI
jgi:hypothetical protein